MAKKRGALARLSIGGKRYEILVDPELAWALKSGERKVDVREVLLGEYVYYDARKGLKASETELEQVFGTDDVYKIAERIIKEGEVQLTAEQRRELIEAKRRQIVEFLSKNCVDPRTGLPHPPKRIELALEEARIGIDPFKPVEAQIADVIKALSPILPLKMARVVMAIRIPAQYVGKAYGPLSKMGKILRSNYLSDGSWSLELEVPAGLQGAVVETVARITRGTGEARPLRSE